MTKQNEEQNRVRKEYAPRGQRGQRMLNFRCDLENYEYLQAKPNKGRYLNQIIEEDRLKNDRR